jgi:hypothetical protein
MEIGACEDLGEKIGGTLPDEILREKGIKITREEIRETGEGEFGPTELADARE